MSLTIDLPIPSFLMPPIEILNRDRMPRGVRDQMEGAVKRIFFERRVVHLRVLQNVFVAQEGLVLHADLTLEQSTIRQHSPDDIDAARTAVLDGQAAGTIPRITGDVVLCRRPGTGNYGHFLVEMLPVAYVAAQHWPRPARFMIQRVDGRLAQVMRECFDRLGISENLRIEAGRMPVLVERLVIVNGLTDHGSYIAPLAMECHDRIAANIPAAPATRLFISRGPTASRPLLDEDRIGQRARASGFASLSPGSLSFAAQVSAFKGAQRIVGVMGATLSNLVFAPRNSEVLVLSPANMPDTFFWFICGLRGITMIDVRCRTGGMQGDDLGWNGDVLLDPADEDMIFSRPDIPAAAPDIAGLFDARYYLAACGADFPAGADPLEHYLTVGWLDGLDPSPRFSTMRYLAAYQDVAQRGSHPLLHYIEHGMGERRSPRP